jgi:hypothetical protein
MYGKAHPTAEGGEPTVLGLAPEQARNAVDAALHDRPIDVAFEAVNQRSDLVVIAKRAAEQPALGLMSVPGATKSRLSNS